MKKIISLILAFMLMSSLAFAASLSVNASITAQNTFSNPAVIGTSTYRGAILNLTGTWIANVVLQRQAISGSWIDVTDNNGNVVVFTTNGTYYFNEPTRATNYRFGVKTGGFTSGTVVGTIEYEQ